MMKNQNRIRQILIRIKDKYDPPSNAVVQICAVFLKRTMSQVGDIKKINSIFYEKVKLNLPPHNIFRIPKPTASPAQFS